MKKFVNLLFKIAIGSCWPLFLPLKEEHEGASYAPWCPAGYMYVFHDMRLYDYIIILLSYFILLYDYIIICL